MICAEECPILSFHLYQTLHNTTPSAGANCVAAACTIKSRVAYVDRISAVAGGLTTGTVVWAEYCDNLAKAATRSDDIGLESASGGARVVIDVDTSSCILAARVAVQNQDSALVVERNAATAMRVFEAYKVGFGDIFLVKSVVGRFE
jgi:hypothetical protein